MKESTVNMVFIENDYVWIDVKPKRKIDPLFRRLFTIINDFDEEKQKEILSHLEDTPEQWARYQASKFDTLDPFMQKDVNALRDEIYEFSYGEFELALNYYGGSEAKILVRHNSEKCSFHEFWVRPQFRYIQGYHFRCPICKGYAGESRIENVLSGLKIDFKPQHSFDDLRGKKNRKMPFDFAVFDKKGKLSFLIEFDGSYHYKTNKKHTEEALKNQQERDAKKDKYCDDHNIDLVRIPYWEFKNIEQILLEKLKEKDFLIWQDITGIF